MEEIWEEKVEAKDEEGRRIHQTVQKFDTVTSVGRRDQQIPSADVWGIHNDCRHDRVDILSGVCVCKYLLFLSLSLFFFLCSYKVLLKLFKRSVLCLSFVQPLQK